MSDATARYQRACELFAELVDLPHAARAKRLIELTQGDEALRREVEAMFAADDNDKRGGDRLHAVVDSAADTILDSAPASDPLEGTTVGRYRIDRLIAAGGMGRVYEARQESPERTVAIKFLDARLVSRSTLNRFRHEAAVMARLVHPGIAQIYEAGAQQEMGGPTPWFAMELVPHAISIIEYAQRRGLTARERIELFLLVCDAAHFGHGRGVVHRDLKPSNVLVDAESQQPQPKIIDFGIALSTNSDMALVTQRTEVGQILGTLHYMSPEQLAADAGAVDVRSDVYALGLLLYELLADHGAFDIAALPVHEAIRVLAVTTPRRLRDAAPMLPSELAIDVETIVSKAIDRDPNRRYSSVAEFGQDLRRLLAHEPISARPPSAIYTARLFARRHRGLVWGAVTAAALLVLGIVGTSIGLVRARHSERVAEDARATAEFDSYVANVIAAEAGLRTRDVKLARERIDAAPVALRGWEWRHLKARVDRSLRMTMLNGARPSALALAAGGRQLAVGEFGGAVRLFDADTLEESWHYQGPRREVSSVAFDAAGSRLVATFERESVLVFDVVSHEIIARLDAPFPRKAAFTSSGDTIIVAGVEGRMARWTLGDGASSELTSADARLEGMLGSAIDPQGRHLVMERGGIAWLVNAETGALESSLGRDWRGDRSHGAGSRAAFSPDGTELIVAIAARELLLRNLLDGHERSVSLDGRGVFAPTWIPGRREFLAGNGKGLITVYDADTLMPLRDFLGHEHPIAAIAATALDGNAVRIASVDWSGALRIWSPDTDDVIRHITNHAWVYDVAFAPDNSWFVTASGEEPVNDPLVTACETRSGRIVWKSPPAATSNINYTINVTPDGRRVIHAGDRGNDTHVRDAGTGELSDTFRDDAISPNLRSVRLRPRHDEYVVHAAGESPRLHALSDGKLIREFALERFGVMAMTPDGARIALAPRPGTGIEVRRIDDGATVSALSTSESVYSMAFSCDGQRLAAWCDDGAILVWDTSTWMLKHTLHADGKWGEQLVFEPVSGHLLGRVAGGVRVWDVERGREIVTFSLPNEPAHGLSLSADGSWLGIGCVDGSVLLLDAPEPRPN